MTNPEQVPQFTVIRYVEEGVGHVQFSFDSAGLATTLKAYDVPSIDNKGVLPDHMLRMLCLRFATQRHQARMDELEAAEPGSVQLVYEENGVDLGSDALGYDLAKRLAPAFENEDIVFDPTYSPVDVEVLLRTPEDNADPERRLGTSILRTVLQPPSLA